jgi:hypothetical protein
VRHASNRRGFEFAEIWQKSSAPKRKIADTPEYRQLGLGSRPSFG